MVAALLVAAFIPVSCFAYDIVKKEDSKNAHKNTIESDLNMNGTKNKITLVKPVPPRVFLEYDIVKDASLRIEGSGQVFSAPLSEAICYKSSGLENIVIADDINPFIAVSSCVPYREDSWAVTLYNFDGNVLTEQLRVTSNEPSIVVKDANSDGTKDIIVMDRDYENDPKVDKLITTYKYVNGKWQRSSMYRTKTKALVKK